MQCIAGKYAPPGADQSTSVVVRGRAGVRHLRPTELAAVRRTARAATAFALNHTGGGDLLSPEFSPHPRPLPNRPAKTTNLTPGRVIPLRPDLAGWTRPLTGGGPLHPTPGRGRHHRPEAPLHLTLAGYAHHTPARQALPQPRPRVRRCASRVRAYVAHPARDLAPLALAVRTYLSQGVR
ncbi:hypothetical protein [Nocardiopsis sp. CC223A]|uniref:hypothetical protein n=1 Tax=Nocardiopsis sp. CC223A TaxID=3044051 RepID=UPI00278BF68A|nr:hypothetical protein [Nocardiopsis sp. CC223A]